MGAASSRLTMIGMNAADNGLRFFFFWLMISLVNYTLGTYVKLMSVVARDVTMAQGIRKLVVA